MCVFCRKKKKEKIFSNELVYACYDSDPVNKGHVLIVTQRHISTYFETLPEERIAIDDAVVTLQKRLARKFRPDGFNIGVNCGQAAGQTVDHLHIHLIPRYKGDVADPTGGVRGVIPSKQHYAVSDRTGETRPRDYVASVAGLDWAHGKWVAAILFLNRKYQVTWFQIKRLTPDQALNDPALKECARIVIDAPIGLITNEYGTGDRPCDKGARRYLSPSFQPCIFAPPMPDQTEYVKKNHKRPRGLGSHAFGICLSIISARQIWEAHPNVAESHPELVFKLLNRERDLSHKKDSIQGQKERRSILKKNLLKGMAKYFDKNYDVNDADIHDAMAMAFVAKTWVRSKHKLAVIRTRSGDPEKIGKNREFIIALPLPITRFKAVPSLFKNV